MAKTNLLALSADEMKEFVKSLGLPGYRASQLIAWIYEKHVLSFDEMTDISKSHRAALEEAARVGGMALLERKTSEDGTEKYLFGLEDGLSVESVLIPDEDRLTLCISSQVGCAVGCRFCLTAKRGLSRNLKAHEIVGQILSASLLISPKRITNIVFMGMGEPLQNLKEVSGAVARMTGLMHFSKRKITISTAGYVPGIKKLPGVCPEVNLAVSLNATTDKVRDAIMPINKKYPIKALLDALRNYPLLPRRRITIEYVMLGGVNDTDDDARRLSALLKGIRSKINLIPFNEHEGCAFKRPPEEKTLHFQEILLKAGKTVLIRKSKGRDILAACGQLRGAS